MDGIETVLFLPPVDEAFLLSELYVAAMFQCLEAVEQNDARLLALINTTLVSVRQPFRPVSNHTLQSLRRQVTNHHQIICPDSDTFLM